MSTPPPPGSAGSDIYFRPTVTVNNQGAGFAGLLASGIGLVTAVSMSNFSITNAVAAYLRDGVEATGLQILGLAAPAAGGQVAPIGPPGILFRRGLFLTVPLGICFVSVTYIPLLTPPD